MNRLSQLRKVVMGTQPENDSRAKFEFEMDSNDALYEAGIQRDEFSRRWIEDYYPVNLSLFNLKVITRCDVHRIEYHDQDFNLTTFPERFKPGGAISLYISGTTAPDKDRHLYRLFFDEENKERASVVEVAEQMHVEIFSNEAFDNDSDSPKGLYLGKVLLPSTDADADSSVQGSCQLIIPEEHLIALVESVEAHPGSSLAMRLHIHCRHMQRDGLVRNVSSARIPDASLLLLEESNCLLEWISSVSPV